MKGVGKGERVLNNPNVTLRPARSDTGRKKTPPPPARSPLGSVRAEGASEERRCMRTSPGAPEKPSLPPSPRTISTWMVPSGKLLLAVEELSTAMLALAGGASGSASL